MGGFSTVTGLETIMNADNASFDGTPRDGAMTTNGQLWIGSTASPHVRKGSLTSVDGSVVITNGAGTINLAVEGITTTWTDEGGNFTADVNNGYFITANATATLPAAPEQGETVAITVDAAATTVTITANTGQVIRIGSAVSAVAGTAANNARGDSVTFVYRSTGSSWIASSVIGTWTVT